MWKDKLKTVQSFMVKHCMVVFPFVVIVAVAATVAIALGADNPDESEIEELLAAESHVETTEETVPEAPHIPDAEEIEANPQDYQLTVSEDPALRTLLETYYGSLASGDVETIQTLSNFVKDTEVVRIQELSKYISSYSVLEIYTKPGPVENSWIAYVYTKVKFNGHEEEVPGYSTFYVCADENGQLYFNDGKNEEEVLEYIRTVNLMQDVVDLNNRVTAEYNELMKSEKQIFDYIVELQREVGIAAGEAIASRVSGENGAGEGENADEGSPEGLSEGTDEGSGDGEPAQPADSSSVSNSQNADLTGTATTTVNVRVSDSEQADKMGKLSAGQQVKVLEQMINGWTKVIYDGQEGYVKSEYLLVTGGEGGSADGSASDGQSPANDTSSADGSSATPSDSGTATRTAVATTNVNIRATASEKAERLGKVVGGDQVEVLSESGEWSQIRYKDIVGYVKSEYLR